MPRIDIASRFGAPLRGYYLKEPTVVGRHQLTLLLFAYIPFSVALLVAVLTSIIGPSSIFFNLTHTVLLTGYALTFSLFFYGKINAASSLSMCTILSQIMLTVEMIYLAIAPTTYHVMIIIANTVMLAMNTMLSMAALLKRNTLILGIATIATYIACMLLAGSTALQAFFPLFVIAFSVVAGAGYLVAKSTVQLNQENLQLKQGEAELLHILRLKRNEVKAFISLASQRCSHDGTRLLLERLDKKSRHNLIANVEELLLTRATELDTVEKAFPEFTPSEREICRLILQGKKLGEICVALCKNESNINSQRANMRRKLGLLSSDNLQKKLQERFDTYLAGN